MKYTTPKSSYYEDMSKYVEEGSIFHTKGQLFFFEAHTSNKLALYANFCSLSPSYPEAHITMRYYPWSNEIKIFSTFIYSFLDEEGKYLENIIDDQDFLSNLFRDIVKEITAEMIEGRDFKSQDEVKGERIEYCKSIRLRGDLYMYIENITQREVESILRYIKEKIIYYFDSKKKCEEKR